MSRWIDADALIAFIRNQYFQCDMPEEWGNGVMWATSQINHYCNKVAPNSSEIPNNCEPQTDEDCDYCKMTHKHWYEHCDTCDHKCVQTEVGCEQTDCAWMKGE